MFLQTVLYLLLFYFILGLPAGIFLISKGLKNLDKGMESMSRGTKLILLPGAVVFWLPMVLKLMKK